MVLPWATAIGFDDHASGRAAMRLSWWPCLSYNAVLPPRAFGHATLPLLCCPASSHASLSFSVRWNSTSHVRACKRIERPKGRLQMCFGSLQSPEQPTERSFWPSLIPRQPIYSTSFSDVDPIQLSELWFQTLRVRRDPKKIVTALRHSFAFVIVLVEDEDAPPTTGSRWKTVGVGRAVSDGTFIATICDVAVDPAYRHRGIGRRIVKKLVENIKRTGGPSGFAVFPPPITRRFFWMIGFRSDRKYKLMAYRGESNDDITEADCMTSTDAEDRLVGPD